MLEERARELGRLIGQSSEYQAVKRASDALHGDREVATLMQKVERIRVDAQKTIDEGGQPTAETERELEELLGSLERNTIYQRMLVAQENFDKVMLRVNDWILDGMRKGSASPIITLG